MRERFDRWLTTRAGKVFGGLGLLGIATLPVAYLWAAPDGYFATFGLIASPLVALVPMFLVLGPLQIANGLRGTRIGAPVRPWTPIAQVAILAYFVLATIAVAVWLKPSVESDRVLLGFEPEVVIAEGDPVVFVSPDGRQLSEVGTVSSTGTYDRRYDPERRYIGLDLDSDAPEETEDAEARVMERAFEQSALELQGLNLDPGPSGSVVFLVGNPESPLVADGGGDSLEPKDSLAVARAEAIFELHSYFGDDYAHRNWPPDPMQHAEELIRICRENPDSTYTASTGSRALVAVVADAAETLSPSHPELASTLQRAAEGGCE